MIATYLYQPEVPSSETILDVARKVLVSCTGTDGIDVEVCEDLLEGLSRAYSAALRHEHSEECDYEPPRFDDAASAEQAYLAQTRRAYRTSVQRAYPKYETDDESIWWPDGLRLHAEHAKSFVLGIAAILGEIEGDRTIAMFRYMASYRAKAAMA